MKNKIILSFLVLSIISFALPQIALAAWWNPMSWNWNIFSWFLKPVAIQQTTTVQDNMQPRPSSNLNSVTSTMVTAQNMNSAQGSSQSQPVKSNILDCKENMRCLIQASVDCEPSQETFVKTYKIPIAGQAPNSYQIVNYGTSTETAISLFEIKGMNNGRCVFRQTYEKVDISIPSSVPQDIATREKNTYEAMDGNYWECEFNTDDLSAILKNWQEGGFSDFSNFGANECTSKNVLLSPSIQAHGM